MKVTVTERLLPLAVPLVTSLGTVHERRVFVLAINDGLGHVGRGEASPLPGFGGEDPKACARALEQAVALMEPAWIASWLDRTRPDAPLGMIDKGLVGSPCARAAVEGALIDLLAQAEGKPVAALLAESPLTAVPASALVAGGEDAADSARWLISEGFRTLKFKAGGDPLAAAAWLKDLVAAIGSEARLRVDINGSWHLEQAAEFATEAGRLVEWLEQPTAADDLAAAAALRRRCPVKVALDESVRTPADVGKVGAAQAADVIVLKPAFLGGWRPTRQACELAHSCGMEVVLTSAMDGAVGRAHATHMAAALGLKTRAHGLATGEWLAEDLSAEPLKPALGYLPIPAEPGLGIGPLLL